MAKQGMFHVTEIGSCVVTGENVSAVDNDVGEDEDTRLPAGWVQIVLRRVVPNPEHAAVAADHAEVLEARRTAVEQQVQAIVQSGAEVDPEELRDTVELAMRAQWTPLENDEPEFAVEVYEFALSPKSIGRLKTLIDPDDFPPGWLS